MTASSSALDEHERMLLAAATGLGRVHRIPALALALRPAFALSPQPEAAGLGIHDEERGLFTYHALLASQPELEIAVVPAAESEARRYASGARRGLALDLPAEASNSFLRALAARGFARFASAPLFFDERLVGTLFVADRDGAAARAVQPYLERLAKIVEPHVWNCFTDERFARGDRRRDALCALSGVINTSLDPRVVLHLSRQAIGSIEGHRASWIGLLDEGGATWRRYDRPSDYAGGADEPESVPVAGTVLARLLTEGRTYESGDLGRKLAFRGDEELFAQGVLRYLATPLRAGGKVLGALLFGTDDPHPALRMDVWLVENMSLQIALAIDNALHHEEVQRLYARRELQNAYLREEILNEHGARGMIGRSRAMRAVFERIARVAETDSTVLISGPTGVGKELVARAIHEASRVRDQPMVKLNCAAIPEGMVESELFGHERGAFTSAHDRRIGRFELARNGTLFLDEVGELSLAVQAKLLRVLQNGEFERVGGTKTLTSNARIIAATNRDLAKSLAGGTFRSDLYYRLNVFPLEVPPLDERREDVPLLVEAFLDQLSRRMGKRITSVEPASLARLCARSWPGNVRELRHVIERAVILCDGPLLAIEEDGATPQPSSGATPSAPSPQLSMLQGLSTLQAVEVAHIRAALERTGGVVEGARGAAALLGLKASTLRFRMKRLGIRRPGSERSP